MEAQSDGWRPRNILTIYYCALVQKPEDTNGPSVALAGSATLVQWLKEMSKEVTVSASISKRIIENDGRGPYAHFGFPIAGLPTSGEELGAQLRSRHVSVVAAHVPDVLAIRLPSGEEIPLEAASPKTKHKSRQQSPSSLNGVSELQIPTLVERTTAKSGTAQSPAAKELLSKIPDLSFMLESKLVLPEK